jgi:hypothetical protein
MGIFLLIIGGVSLDKSIKASWAVGSMLLAWNVMYQFSVSIDCTERDGSTNERLTLYRSAQSRTLLSLNCPLAD